MNYRITGSDQTSGREVTVVIEAADASAAERWAEAHGIIFKSAEAVGEIDEAAGDAHAEGAGTVEAPVGEDGGRSAGPLPPPPVDPPWYYAIGDRQEGPVTRAVLVSKIQSGELRPDMLVWSAGMGSWLPAMSVPALHTVGGAARPVRLGYATPQPMGPGESIERLIPYRNMPALLSYYFGVFSIIPMIGIVLGIAAMILGVSGLKRARVHPEARGEVHAWVGIVTGAIFTSLYLFLLSVMLR